LVALTQKDALTRGALYGISEIHDLVGSKGREHKIPAWIPRDYKTHPELTEAALSVIEHQTMPTDPIGYTRLENDFTPHISGI
jgi:hypothetical protein